MAAKKSELALNIDKKRLELLKMKVASLAERRTSDPEIERQIVELSARVRAYEAPPAAIEVPKGLVQLKKKQADGTVVRV